MVPCPVAVRFVIQMQIAEQCTACTVIPFLYPSLLSQDKSEEGQDAKKLIHLLTFLIPACPMAVTADWELEQGT